MGWRTPEQILRRYDETLATAQIPPDISSNPTCIVATSEDILTKELDLPEGYIPPPLLCVSTEGTFPVCRRLDNDMINGTQLLYALGKGKFEAEWVNRTLKAEQQKQIIISHQFAQMQGIWIPFERALGYVNNMRAIERFYPLFVVGLVREARSLAGKPSQQESIDTSDRLSGNMEDQSLANQDDTLATSEKRDRHHAKLIDETSKEMSEMNLKETVGGVDEAKVPIPSIADVLAKADGAESGALKDPRPLSTSTSSTSHTTSDESNISDEGAVPTSVELKDMLLTRLMDYFFSVFSTTPARQPHNYQRGSASSANTRQSSTTGIGDISSNNTPRSGSNKRRKISQDEDELEGDDDNKSNRGPKEDKPNRDSVPPNRRLACPYFKHNPRKYQGGRSCCGPGWRSVNRIKEHLYRNHAMPLHCFRCHEVFHSNLELEEHSRRPDPTQCTLSPNLPDFLEGRFNSDQEKLLRSRRKHPKETTEEEKWVGVYHILFPAEDPAAIPSPYYEIQDNEVLSSEDPAGQDASELERYESFLRRELPVHVRRELEVRINETLFPLEESLRGQLVDIVRDLQLNLFEVYKASRGGNSSTSDSNMGDAAIQGSGCEDNEDEGSQDVNTTGDIDTIGVSATGWAEQRTDTAGTDTGPMSFRELDDELAAFRPAQPYAEESLGDFDGLLFDFPVEPWTGSGVGDSMAEFEEAVDSGYGGSSTGCFPPYKDE